VRVSDKGLGKTEEKLSGWGKLSTTKDRGHENRNPLFLIEQGIVGIPGSPSFSGTVPSKE
jgi:hypothetical protein